MVAGFAMVDAMMITMVVDCVDAFVVTRVITMIITWDFAILTRTFTIWIIYTYCGHIIMTTKRMNMTSMIDFGH